MNDKIELIDLNGSADRSVQCSLAFLSGGASLNARRMGGDLLPTRRCSQPDQPTL